MGSGAPNSARVGVSTVPEMVVLAPPGQLTWRRHRLVQAPLGLPHTPGMPEPPQVSLPGQPPQSCTLPQLSPIIPQYLPVGGVQLTVMQVPGVGAQTLAVPAAPQLWPAGQSPHSRVLPQPSPILPQYRPLAAMQVIGVQVVGAQTFGVPATPQA